MPVGTSDGKQYESQFQYTAGIDEQLNVADKHGGDRTRGVDPPRDPLAPLFNPMMRMESDIPDAGILTNKTNPDLIMQPNKFRELPDMGTHTIDQEFMRGPNAGNPRGQDVPPRANTPKERLSFVPDTSEGQGGWPRVSTGYQEYFDLKKLKAAPEGAPESDYIVREHGSESLGKVLKSQTQEYEGKHGLDMLDKIGALIQGKEKEWDAWLENAPQSTNIQDRREGQTNGQVLREMFNDFFTINRSGDDSALADQLGAKDIGVGRSIQSKATERQGIMNTSPIPQMSGLTAEIDKQAGGFQSGPAGTGKKIDLKKTASDTDVSGTHPTHTFKFKNAEGKKGELQVSEHEDGRVLYVDWVGKAGKEPYSTGPNSFGKADMRDMMQQLKKEFPEAEIIGGHRVSGARDKAGAVGGTYMPLKSGYDKELLKELRDKAAERLTRDQQILREPSLIESRQSVPRTDYIPHYPSGYTQEDIRRMEQLQAANRRVTR